MDMNATFDYVQDVIGEQVMITHVRNVNLVKVNTAYLSKGSKIVSYSDDESMGDMGPLGGGGGVEL
ncbi:hypothetical protein [uncultured Shewanella sp.]|uniref:hypothetical protein n=1 Tax=uncultured Shewanella sp. TaxID=173975 RepID=UPI0026385356|nr:hypothetical protein [uncultured Shewanella sp.]